MTTTATVFLGIIALATLVTAIMQLALLFAAAKLVKRLTTFVEDIDREVRPILGHVGSIARDASRVASMAAAQVERADQLLTTAVHRVEEVLASMQGLISRTLRDGNALMMGIRAVLAAFRSFQSRRHRRGEEDEALFI